MQLLRLANSYNAFQATGIKFLLVLISDEAFNILSFQKLCIMLSASSCDRLMCQAQYPTYITYLGHVKVPSDTKTGVGGWPPTLCSLCLKEPVRFLKFYLQL